MKCTERLLLSAALVAGGFLLAAHAAPAAGPGISVYTWTDANGTTHFSDAPRKGGPAKLVVVPTPPPSNATVLAANQAWLAALDRDTQARLARDAAQRRAETESEAAIAAQAAQQTEYKTESAQYVPLYLPVRHHYHRGRNRYGSHGPWNSSPSRDASFPQYSLPSSFPPGLPSSFPETQNSSLAASPPR